MNRRRQWDAWLAAKPAIVRVLGRRFKPWNLYRLTETGKVGHVVAFSNDGTVTVAFGGMFPRAVFGIKPGDLEPVNRRRQASTDRLAALVDMREARGVPVFVTQVGVYSPGVAERLGLPPLHDLHPTHGTPQ